MSYIRVAKPVSNVLIICLFFTVFMIVFCRDASTHFNGIDPITDREISRAIFTRFYFSVVTASTTGYGDISPKSVTCKLITTIVILACMVNIIASFATVN